MVLSLTALSYQDEPEVAVPTEPGAAGAPPVAEPDGT